MAKSLVGQACSALCSSASQHFASVFGCHSLAETVLFFSLQFFRLIRSNHSETLLSRRNLAIIKYIVFGQAMSISKWTKPPDFQIFLPMDGKFPLHFFHCRITTRHGGADRLCAQSPCKRHSTPIRTCIRPTNANPIYIEETSSNACVFTTYPMVFTGFGIQQPHPVTNPNPTRFS